MAERGKLLSDAGSRREKELLDEARGVTASGARFQRLKTNPLFFQRDSEAGDHTKSPVIGHWMPANRSGRVSGA